MSMRTKEIKDVSVKHYFFNFKKPEVNTTNHLEILLGGCIRISQYCNWHVSVFFKVFIII